jgi:hypothetical protein
MPFFITAPAIAALRGPAAAAVAATGNNTGFSDVEVAVCNAMDCGIHNAYAARLRMPAAPFRAGTREDARHTKCARFMHQVTARALQYVLVRNDFSTVFDALSEHEQQKVIERQQRQQQAPAPGEAQLRSAVRASFARFFCDEGQRNAYKRGFLAGLKDILSGMPIQLSNSYVKAALDAYSDAPCSQEVAAPPPGMVRRAVTSTIRVELSVALQDIVQSSLSRSFGAPRAGFVVAMSNA